MEPCPMCASDRTYYACDGESFWRSASYWIRCNDCEHEGPTAPGVSEAENDWDEWSWFCRRYVNSGRLGYGVSNEI